MKLTRVLSTALLSIVLVGPAALSYAQQEPQGEKHSKPEKQAEPAKQKDNQNQEQNKQTQHAQQQQDKQSQHAQIGRASCRERV